MVSGKVKVVSQKIFRLTNYHLLLTTFLFFLPLHGAAWGFWAHRMINKQAAATLPKGMTRFYNFYLGYLTDHSVDADIRRSSDVLEAPRHFIEMDHYCQYPCNSFPIDWKDAVSKYNVDTLNRYGTLPWYISIVYFDLVKAFKEGNTKRILQLSSDLGHYIADSYVPLHTTKNYDGQLTNQAGIHGLWESNIPELLGQAYNFDVGKAKYIEDQNTFIWRGILSSYSEVDSVLSLEKELNHTFPHIRKYSLNLGSKQPFKTYSNAYTKAYSNKLNGMVERRMRASIDAVGCLWMSAWVDAGQPDLDKLVQ